MNKVLCFVAAATLLTGAAAHADLDTALLIDQSGESLGQVTGDITGQNPVTVWELPGPTAGDLWNNGDTFMYLHDSERKTGDFTATVRVAGQTAALDGRWGKGGLMIRNQLTPDSSNAMPAIYTGNGSQIDPPTPDSNVMDHSPVDVRVNGRTLNNTVENSFERPMLRDGAPFRNNLAPPAAPGATDSDFNQAWLRVQFKAESNTILGAYADDVDGAPGEWAYSLPMNDVDVPAEGWYVGLAYSAHDSTVAEDLVTDDNPDGLHGLIFDNYSFVPEFILPRQKVSGDDIGALALGGVVTNEVLGPEEAAPGATNYFYDGNIRGIIEGDNGFLERTGRGSSAERDPGLFGPIYNPVAWWAGDGGPSTIDGVEYPKYPSGAFTGDNQDNYAAVATGQIFIPENGDFTFVDLVDDFTMFAIDLNGDGELESVDSLGDLDVPGTAEFGGFDDIAILDDDWVNADGGGGDGNGNNVSDVTFEDVASGGEWRDFELWMSDGTGGDRGIMVMAPSDEALEVPLSQEQLDAFVIKPDQVRTLTRPILSGDSTAQLSTEADFVLQVGADGNDQISVDDNGGVLTTTLDVAGATVTIEASEGLMDGAELQIFDADMVVGVADLTLNLDDPSAWDLSRLGEGILVFGAATGGCDPNSGGDLDGNGMVDFADFLALSGNFGQAVDSHTQGDIDCNGTVEFADFLTLSGNFGQTVAAESVPEPASWAMFSLAAMFAGSLRRRRK